MALGWAQGSFFNIFVDKYPRAAFGGEIGGSEAVWRAFSDTVARYELTIEPFEAMIDGQESDLVW